MSRRTWEFLEASALERTTGARIGALLGILAVLLFVLFTSGCTAAGEWCDTNPRSCEVVVVAAGAIMAGCVAAVAVSATRSNEVRVNASRP